MPQPNFFTGVRLLQHPLGYSPAASPLLPRLHLRKGSFNLWTPVGGTLDRRPGFKELFNSPGETLRIRRAVEAEDKSLVATVYNSTTQLYELWYKVVDGSWTQVPEVRDINSSQSPHEMLWIRRKLYAKGNPTADLYGSILFNLDDPTTTKWWGLGGPLDAPEFRPVSEWVSSGTDRVVPQIGARYAYTYVSSTGHESSRSLFTDFSALEEGRYPRLRFPAQIDTTNIPYFNIYRTGDGGGALFFVEQITNTGAIIDWDDENFEPGGNFTSLINTSRPAPGPADNDPPPTVEEGEIGVDAIERSSPIVLWGGRIIFAVGRNLYWSVDDEAVQGSGKLEESFRGGSVRTPNRATFGERVVDLVATDIGVCIFTEKNTFVLTGHRRSEIRVELLLPNLGAFDRHCSVAVGSGLYWLDQNLDLRFLQLRSELTELTPRVLSTPLGGEHREDMSKYFQLNVQYIPDYTFITVFVASQTGSALTPVPEEDETIIYVYDLNREIWFPPWEPTASAIWERFQISSLAKVGQLDTGTYQDFGVDLDSRIVSSSLTLIGEADLNISDVDFVFQNINAIELVWVGDTLTTQVKIGVDLLVGSIFDLDEYTDTERSDPIAHEPINMRRGTFWLLPGSRSTGRYFNFVIDIPQGNNLWSLLNALFVFGSLGDSKSIQRS